MAELRLKAQSNVDGSVTIRVAEPEQMIEVGKRAERTPSQELRLALMRYYESRGREFTEEDYKAEMQKFIRLVEKGIR